MSSLRRVWMQSPVRKAVKSRQHIRGTRLYLCEMCRKAHVKVEVDHKVPVGSPIGEGGWEGFMRRLFCNESGLRLLCRPCHKRVNVGALGLAKRIPNPALPPETDQQFELRMGWPSAPETDGTV